MADFKRFKIGDVVTLSDINAYDRYSTLWQYVLSGTYDGRRSADPTWRVSDIKWGGKYEYQERSRAYENSQLIRIGSSPWFDAENFRLLKGDAMGTTLAIDVDRPCMVQEIKETTVDGKVVIEGVGDFYPFDSSRAANVWAAEQISNSIRSTNTYRKFRIYQEKSVAQAKKPEIEYV